MIRLNYTFMAKQPIFTGSDENYGTERKLRREKVLLSNPIIIESKYKTEETRRKAIIGIIQAIWKEINFEKIKGERLMKIYDEFASKLLASTGVRTKYQFLNSICERFGIRSIANNAVISMLNNFTDDEFLQTIRDEYQYLVLLLRTLNKEKKEEGQLNLFGNNNKEKPEKVIFKKTSENIPFIAGNSIRGILRRILMHDFCKQVDITKLPKNIYHQLFTGGNITDSTGFEDIGKREELISMCPPLGLLGSAIGNQTIEGALKVGGARPECREHKTGDISFWELLSTEFGTRHDDSKTESKIEIVENKEKEAPTTQMIYSYEVFVVGTKFNHAFAVSDNNELLVSCFWHMLDLFKEQPYIGGSSAVGNGEIDLEYIIPKGANKLYLDYLSENQEKIKKYFENGLD